MTFLKRNWQAKVMIGLFLFLGPNLGLRAEDPTSSVSAKSIDSNLHLALREVINQGADIFNQGDQSGCYRLFEGALITARSQLGHHADVQKLIDEGLARTESGSMGKRAWALRKLLDDVRDKINPNPKKSGEKSKASETQPVKPQEKKIEDGKKSDDANKKDDKKPSDSDSAKKNPESPSKKDDKKPGDAKPQDKKPDDKSKKAEDKSKDK
jgi:hypothetical protein